MKPRLYLIDAHAFLHRAYHALPPLTSPTGEPVGALYGFVRLLLQILKKEKPERLVVCFDMPGPTFRHDAYKEYKATRKEIDRDLLSQLKQAEAMTRAIGFACAAVVGYEADDLMATLARKAVKSGYDAVLVTGDKDALQMVGPGIRVFNVAKNIWMDAPVIEEKLGVPPESVVDYLALFGDSSDNVPGVAGIGPVSAVKLLKKYGNLQHILSSARAGDVGMTPKIAQTLMKGEKDALTAKSLITLVENAPVPVEPEDCLPPAPAPETIAPLFEKLGFKSLLTEILNGREIVPAATASIQECLFDDVSSDIAQAKCISVACIENDQGNLINSSSAYFAFGLPDGRACVLDSNGVQSARAILARVLTGPAVKAGWDLKSMRRALEPFILEITGKVCDVMLAQYCLNPVMPRDDGKSNTDNPRARALALLERVGDYREWRRRMEENGVLELFDAVEQPLSEILRAMEDVGIALDAQYLRDLSAEFEGDIRRLKNEIDDLVGVPINVNSPKQLSELLFDKLGLPVIHKTAKGGRSTDEDALKELAALNPIPAKVIEYRELSKLKSTYIDGLLDRMDSKTYRVHTHFDQTGTTTGRLSSLDPNLQNIPIRSMQGQKIRRAFVARSGYTLVSADYSQIDLRVLAHVSDDAVLKKAFVNDEDIHLRTACEMFHTMPDKVDKDMRRRAKAINFGIVYGQTPFGLSAELGIPQGEAAAYIKKYFERLPGVAAWIDKNLEQARRDGFVRTLLGRVRYLPELSAKNTGMRQFAERAARNTPIQGGSADIIKLAMLEVQKHFTTAQSPSQMLLQVHDELLFETPQSEVKDFAPWIKKIMESVGHLNVPLRVDVKVGPNWQDMEAF